MAFSIPSLGVPEFVSRRRRPLTWLAGTVGGIYLLGRWGVQKMGEAAEKSRKEGVDKENLSRRFNLNIQDCQFTILALLPTFSSQVFQEMDVEGASAELAQQAARQKARERQASHDAEESRRRDAEVAAKELEREAEKVQEKQTLVDSTGSTDLPAINGHSDMQTNSPEPNKPHVRNHVDEALRPFETNGLEKSTELPNLSESTTILHSSPGPIEQHSSLNGVGMLSLKEGKNTEDPDKNIIPDLQIPEPEVELPPERSRAELWNDIKILSFTRTITSIYVMTLLSLQIHVQLNLLGRASYVTSILSTIPDSASSTSLDSNTNLSISNDEDLELALYAQKTARKSRAGISSETERKYLTFSWWLLHRGWTVLAKRVQSAVEEVVGPIPLKSAVVYGELSTLLNQIRQRVEYEVDGSLHEFASVLYPRNYADERETLRSGGIPDSDLLVSPELRHLLNETSDLLDSTDCALVRKLCLDRLFSQLLSALEGPFRPSRSLQADDVDWHSQGSRFEDVTERTARLASLLPTVARQTHIVLNSIPNEYMEVLEDVRELGEFSAIIYSSFDREDPRSCC